MTRQAVKNGAREPPLQRWLGLLDEVLLSDRARLSRLLAAARRAAMQAAGRAEAARVLREFRSQLRRSKAVVASRSKIQPGLDMPPDLPLTEHRAVLLAAIAKHPVTIVCGATGSGKSTQLPKLCLALGRGLRGRIGLTQPRRLAARTIAGRIATETATTLGQCVGYQTRFEQVLNAATRVKVMTDGILLQEIQRDRQLLAYDTLIIDEVHERSVNVDLLLGYLRKLLPSRPDLRVVLTSATIDAERYAAFFEGAAIVEVPGRSHAIEVRYRPPEPGGEGDLNQALLRAIEELDQDARGDVLIFLPGEREIFEARDFLQQAGLPGTEVLPLYARLSSADQQRIFAPHPRRHLVLATNVAETSLTVPGVRHVIDSGLVRISSYSPRTKLQRLPVVANSQASAEQRKGRCGRERAGICIRLYSEDDYAARPAHTPPELLRSNLAGVVLRLADMGLPALDSFPLLDPPTPRAINDGYTVLRELGALDERNSITAQGRQLARLPLDPRLARIVVAAGASGCLREALIITAGLSAGDIREWPREARALAQTAHAESADPRSEFRWMLKTWETLQPVFAERSRRAQGVFCREQFWSWRRAREWQSVHSQLCAAALKLGLPMNPEPADYRALHVALLTGFALRIGRREEGGGYQGCRNLRFRLHPAATLRERAPRWLVAAEITETSAAFARLAALIEPAWVVSAVPQLIRRAHSLPFWDLERGRVLVREEQSLQGLVLASEVLVDYATLAPAAARALFVDAALVAGELGATPDFFLANQQLLADVAGWEARVRRFDLQAEPAQLADFYLARLPAHVASRRALLRWLAADKAGAAALVMQWPDVTRDHVGPLAAHLFPATLVVAGCTLSLAYLFAPASAADGVTASVPVAVLAQLDALAFERLVPGLLREKILALLKALPKVHRRAVSPMNEFAGALTSAVESLTEPLSEALSAAVLRMTGTLIPVETWRAVALPEHLQMRFSILGDAGEELGSGRDLPSLQRTHAAAMAQAFSAASWSIQGHSLGGWCFGAIPQQTTTLVAGVPLLGYPALTPSATQVSVSVLREESAALALHRQGVIRLLILSAGAPLKYLRRQVVNLPRAALAAPLFGWRTSLADWLIEAGFADTVGVDLPRDEAAFNALLATVNRSITGVVQALADDFGERLVRGAATLSRLNAVRERLPLAAWRDLREQFDELLGPAGLLVQATHYRRHAARYLRALETRLDRALVDPAKDTRKLAQIQPLLLAFAERTGTGEETNSAHFRYLLQELRVAIFAPELSTAEPVSVARIAALLAAKNPL